MKLFHRKNRCPRCGHELCMEITQLIETEMVQGEKLQTKIPCYAHCSKCRLICADWQAVNGLLSAHMSGFMQTMYEKVFKSFFDKVVGMGASE